MKRLFFVLLMFVFAAPMFGQDASRTFTLSSTTQIGPTPPIDLRGSGINLHGFTWSTTGTVSAGACALQGGANGTTFATTIIAAQTVTSSGTYLATLASSTSNYVRINCTTAIVGTGTVTFRYMGWTLNPLASGGVLGTVTANAGTGWSATGLNLETTQLAVKTAIENISTGSVVVINTGNKGNGNTPGSTAINTIPCLASTAAPTPTTATAVYISCDTLKGGVRMVQEYPSGLPEGATLASGAVTSAMTGTTSTSVIGGTASNYIYVTQCTVSNASLTVSTDIILQDGSGGTTLFNIPAPAATVATTGGGGAVVPFPSPLKVPTAGNALYAANVTTGSSTKISCAGYKSTVSY